MFYVIEIASGDPAISGKAVYEYADKTKAEAAYHKKIGTAMDSELYTAHTAIIIDNEGAVYGSHYFAR